MMSLIKQLILPFFIITASFIVINITIAEEKIGVPQEVNSESKNDADNVDKTKKILEQIALIEKTFEMEGKEILDLFAYLEDILGKKREFESQTNVYKIELTTFGSQLHLPDVETKLLEKAYMSSQAAVGKLTKDVARLKEKSEQLKQSQQISYEQKINNDKFLMELQFSAQTYSNKEITHAKEITTADAASQKQISPKNNQQETLDKKQIQVIDKPQRLSPEQQLESGKYGDPQQRAALKQRVELEEQLQQEQNLLAQKKLEEEKKAEEEQRDSLNKLTIKLKFLQTALTKKMLLMQSIISIISGEIPELEEIQSKYKTLASELEIRIRDSKKAELLTRKTNPLTQGRWKQIGEDISEFLSIVDSIFDLKSWENSFSFLWLSGLHKLISFIIILFLVSLISIRFKILIKKFSSSSPHLEKRYWSRVVLGTFANNLVLSAVTAFFYLCIKFRLFFNYAIVANLIVEILMILIFILWLIYFFENIKKRYPKTPVKELIFFLKALNLVAIIYILFGTALKSDSTIVIGYRLLCEIMFYGWLIYFLKKLMPEMTRYCERQNKTIQMIPTFYKNGVILAAIVGIVLELLGYGTLAFYWYTSWGKTVVVLMWSALIIGASKEWIISDLSDDANQAKDSAAHTHSHQTHPHGLVKSEFSILWLIRKLSFIVMFFGVTIALMLSWASSDFVFAWLYTILSFKFTVGSMSFSIFTIFEAMVIIIITHFFANIWRNFFKKNILGESGLDQGLQESMTTITVYSIWIIGIFTALIVFGLNTTTLTVAFGALSIGIGFGLQNVVSNFISGIILLFERPIQVGDDIEVGGIWATVKKTNVRSTLVQTYDNATIIIPNSELISNRVTNWSFKDRRLRRKVKVGVEYSSDVELVRKTLLEVAGRTPRVLKFPEPDVLFEDFGDSALIFGLRFWTFTDYCITVETDIRFKISKAFKEKGIVMAFPQQDIHIKSVPSNFIVAEKPS
ncbi:MAG: mechanosensitive ion channel [Desulfamplus sp.]|nr:mechanosensitive ion channel [Desulfamplus sp.]